MDTAARPQLDFAGHDRFIAAIDAAVASGDQHTVTAALRGALCNLIRDPDVHLPPCVYEPIEERYARREIYRSPERGYSIVAMTWGPGQGTPLHDHCGLWCVEGVWEGELEITQYELIETDGSRYRFRTAGGMQASSGSAGSLIPPYEYHTIRNASRDKLAVTVHVYQGPMDHCGKFLPQGSEWYRRVDSTLALDRVT